MKKLATILLLTALTAGCASDEDQSNKCSDGGTAIEKGETRLCHYTSELIIEGFECPPEVPHRTELEDDIICASDGDLSGEDLADLVRDELGRTCCAEACNECVPVSVTTTGSLTDDLVGTWFVPPDRIFEIRDDGTWARRCLLPEACVDSCEAREGTWEVQTGELVLIDSSGASSHEVLDLSASTLLVSDYQALLASGHDDLRPWVRVQCNQLSPSRDATPAAACDDGADSGNRCIQDNPGSTCIAYDELPGELFSVCGEGRPRLDVNETLIDLGTVPVGVATIPHQFSVSNGGLGPLEVSWQVAAPFATDGQISLAPKTGSAHAGGVIFQSPVAGSFEGTLSFTSNGGEHTVELKAVAE